MTMDTISQQTRLDWVDNKMRVIALLTKARSKFPNDEQFEIWLANNGLDQLDREDLFAAINLGQNMELCLTALLESDSFNLRTIWAANQGRYGRK
jgi:hypothetical protein